MSVKLKVSTAGQGHHLVFLHGWGVNSGVWQPLIDLLKSEFCITTIDLPGYGLNSQQIPVPYDLQNIALLVANELPPDCTLIGWSLGGLVAQQIASTMPLNVKRLVLICSTPKFSKSGDWPGIEPKVLDFFTQQLKVDHDKTLDRFLAIHAMGSTSARRDTKTIKAAVQKYPPPCSEALVAGLDMLKSIDLREQFQTLIMPCQIFLGGLDTLVPSQLMPKLQQLNPSLSVELLPEAAHAPFISHTDIFAKGLRKVISS